MSVFRKLKESFGKGKLKKEQQDELFVIMQDAVLDGKISDKELQRINNFYRQSELDDNEFQDLKDAFFWQVVQTLISDRKITNAENTAFEHISNILEISPQVYKLSNKEVSYFHLLNSVSNGVLPQISPKNIILRKNETAHFSAVADLLEERVIKRNYVGGSQGVSIRIMKGVSYRVGANRGKIESEKGIVSISSGDFVITNQRLVFSGNKKSFSHNLDRLIDIQLFSDALQFSVTNRQNPILLGMYSDRAVEICGTIISKVINS